MTWLQKQNIILLVAFISILISIISFFYQSNSKIVIFDKETVFKRYYQTLSALVLHSKNRANLKSQLVEKNQKFVAALSHDLSDFQHENHVIIIKRNALAAPSAFNATEQDITPFITKKLERQGVIS